MREIVIKNHQILLVLEEDEIPQGCECVALFQINCKDGNRTSIPQTFPTNVSLSLSLL